MKPDSCPHFSDENVWVCAGKSHQRERLGTVDLLVLNRLNNLLCVVKILFNFYTNKLLQLGGELY